MHRKKDREKGGGGTERESYLWNIELQIEANILFMIFDWTKFQ